MQQAMRNQAAGAGAGGGLRTKQDVERATQRSTDAVRGIIQLLRQERPEEAMQAFSALLGKRNVALKVDVLIQVGMEFIACRLSYRHALRVFAETFKLVSQQINQLQQMGQGKAQAASRAKSLALMQVVHLAAQLMTGYCMFKLGKTKEAENLGWKQIEGQPLVKEGVQTPSSIAYLENVYTVLWKRNFKDQLRSHTMNLLSAHMDLVAFAFGKNSKNMFGLLPSVGAIAFDFDPGSAEEHYARYIQHPEFAALPLRKQLPAYELRCLATMTKGTCEDGLGQIRAILGMWKQVKASLALSKDYTHEELRGMSVKELKTLLQGPRYKCTDKFAEKGNMVEKLLELQKASSESSESNNGNDEKQNEKDKTIKDKADAELTTTSAGGKGKGNASLSERMSKQREANARKKKAAEEELRASMPLRFIMAFMAEKRYDTALALLNETIPVFGHLAAPYLAGKAAAPLVTDAAPQSALDAVAMVQAQVYCEGYLTKLAQLDSGTDSQNSLKGDSSAAVNRQIMCMKAGSTAVATFAEASMTPVLAQIQPSKEPEAAAVDKTATDGEVDSEKKKEKATLGLVRAFLHEAMALLKLKRFNASVFMFIAVLEVQKAHKGEEFSNIDSLLEQVGRVGVIDKHPQLVPYLLDCIGQVCQKLQAISKEDMTRETRQRLLECLRIKGILECIRGHGAAAQEAFRNQIGLLYDRAIGIQISDLPASANKKQVDAVKPQTKQYLAQLDQMAKSADPKARAQAIQLKRALEAQGIRSVPLTDEERLERERVLMMKSALREVLIGSCTLLRWGLPAHAVTLLTYALKRAGEFYGTGTDGTSTSAEAPTGTDMSNTNSNGDGQEASQGEVGLSKTIDTFDAYARVLRFTIGFAHQLMGSNDTAALSAWTAVAHDSESVKAAGGMKMDCPELLLAGVLKSSLGGQYMKQNRKAEALPYYVMSFMVVEHLYGPEHDVLAESIDPILVIVGGDTITGSSAPVLAVSTKTALTIDQRKGLCLTSLFPADSQTQTWMADVFGRVVVALGALNARSEVRMQEAMDKVTAQGLANAKAKATAAKSKTPGSSPEAAMKAFQAQIRQSQLVIDAKARSTYAILAASNLKVAMLYAKQPGDVFASRGMQFWQAFVALLPKSRVVDKENADYNNDKEKDDDSLADKKNTVATENKDGDKDKDKTSASKALGNEKTKQAVRQKQDKDDEIVVDCALTIAAWLLAHKDLASASTVLRDAKKCLYDEVRDRIAERPAWCALDFAHRFVDGRQAAHPIQCAKRQYKDIASKIDSLVSKERDSENAIKSWPPTVLSRSRRVMSFAYRAPKVLSDSKGSLDDAYKHLQGDDFKMLEEERSVGLMQALRSVAEDTINSEKLSASFNATMQCLAIASDLACQQDAGWLIPAIDLHGGAISSADAKADTMDILCQTLLMVMRGLECPSSIQSAIELTYLINADLLAQEKKKMKLNQRKQGTIQPSPVLLSLLQRHLLVCLAMQTWHSFATAEFDAYVDELRTAMKAQQFAPTREGAGPDEVTQVLVYNGQVASQLCIGALQVSSTFLAGGRTTLAHSFLAEFSELCCGKFGSDPGAQTLEKELRAAKAFVALQINDGETDKDDADVAWYLSDACKGDMAGTSNGSVPAFSQLAFSQLLMQTGTTLMAGPDLSTAAQRVLHACVEYVAHRVGTDASIHMIQLRTLYSVVAACAKQDECGETESQAQSSITVSLQALLSDFEDQIDALGGPLAAAALVPEYLSVVQFTSIRLIFDGDVDAALEVLFKFGKNEAMRLALTAAIRANAGVTPENGAANTADVTFANLVCGEALALLACGHPKRAVSLLGECLAIMSQDMGLSLHTSEKYTVTDGNMGGIASCYFSLGFALNRWLSESEDTAGIENALSASEKVCYERYLAAANTGTSNECLALRIMPSGVPGEGFVRGAVMVAAEFAMQGEKEAAINAARVGVECSMHVCGADHPQTKAIKDVLARVS
jgi:hypothetical protein